MIDVSQGHRFKDLPTERSYCERCGMWLSYFTNHRKESGVSCKDEIKRNGNYGNNKEGGEE